MVKLQALLVIGMLVYCLCVFGVAADGEPTLVVCFII